MAKTNISIHTIDDWEELKQFVNEFAHWPNYIFRGHGEKDWLLESTLSRALKKIKEEDKEELVKEHLKLFTLEIRGRRGSNPRKLTDNELWALGQHYGLYTPLLDWSESPWVALFFALTSIEKSVEKKRVLWALHKPDISKIKYPPRKDKLVNSPNSFPVEIIEPIIDENSRLVNQRGVFTKIDVRYDLQTWIEKAPNFGDWNTLYKVIFPDALRDKILLELNLMNINYSSLFPDLEGSSRHVNIRLLQTDYISALQSKERGED